jgi:hypothetical protein
MHPCLPLTLRVVVGCALATSLCATACGHQSQADQLAQLEQQLGLGHYADVRAGMARITLPLEQPAFEARLTKLQLIADAGLGRAEEALADLEAHERAISQPAPPDVYARVLRLLAAADAETDAVLARAVAAYPAAAPAFKGLVAEITPWDYSMLMCPRGHGPECHFCGWAYGGESGCTLIWSHDSKGWTASSDPPGPITR